MATISEIKQLREQMATERKAEEAAVKAKISTLSKTPVPDLVALKDHWATEQKRNRKLDEFHRVNGGMLKSGSRRSNTSLHTLGGRGFYGGYRRESRHSTSCGIPEGSVSTLYHWTHEGKIPHSTAGSKKLVFAKPDLDAFT